MLCEKEVQSFCKQYQPRSGSVSKRSVALFLIIIWKRFSPIKRPRFASAEIEHILLEVLGGKVELKGPPPAGGLVIDPPMLG